MFACIAALNTGGAARADLITTPDGFGDGFELETPWYVGCDYEYPCGNDIITLGNTATNYSGFGEVIITAPTGENFAYTETDNLFGQKIDYTLTNLGSVAGPLTFTFASASTADVEGFGTTLYSHDGDFTATVSAYDAQVTCSARPPLPRRQTISARPTWHASSTTLRVTRPSSGFRISAPATPQSHRSLFQPLPTSNSAAAPKHFTMTSIWERSVSLDRAWFRNRAPLL